MATLPQSNGINLFYGPSVAVMLPEVPHGAPPAGLKQVLEAGGPTAHMVWNIHSVIGLKKHQCGPNGAPHRSIQLVVVVPSTPTVNPGVEEAQIAFSPNNFAQLHNSKRLPRIIVPLSPRSSPNEVARYVDALASGEQLKKLKSLPV